MESTQPNSQIENHEEWEHALTERGYHHVYFDRLNQYYIADELNAAFMALPNFFDYFKRASEVGLKRHAQWLKKELDTAKAALIEQQPHSQWLKNEWDSVKDSSDQVEATAQQFHAELHSVYVNRS